MVIRNFLTTSLLIFAINTFADTFSIAKTSAYNELTQATSETFKYDEYYVFAQRAGEQIDLSAFAKVSAPFPLPEKPYDRDTQFGEWIKPLKSSCLNTRGVVLKRDSKVDVKVNEKCTVMSGDWYDPYTNTNFNEATDVQIDHVVALKNAYMTGAHTWTQAKRCLYANFLGNEFHLLVVNGPENLRKSDKSPLDWTPPNRGFVCEYLRHWLQIKYIWQLKLTPREVKAIQNEIAENHCLTEDMTVAASEVAAQRQYIETNKNLCQ